MWLFETGSITFVVALFFCRERSCRRVLSTDKSMKNIHGSGIELSITQPYISPIHSEDCQATSLLLLAFLISSNKIVFQGQEKFRSLILVRCWCFWNVLNPFIAVSAIADHFLLPRYRVSLRCLRTSKTGSFFNTGRRKNKNSSRKLKPKTQGKNSTSGKIFPPFKKVQEKTKFSYQNSKYLRGWDFLWHFY